MRKTLVILLIILLTLPLLAQKKVSDLKFHNLQNYSWLRLAKIVPEVTDRVILPTGTLESHGAVAVGSDNIVPLNLAERIWKKCNALIAPPINYGYTGISVSEFPGSIVVREEIFEEYIYDVLKGLVKTGFNNILIIDGHGGNKEPTKRAMTRLHLETQANFMMVDWWKIGWDITKEVYGQPAQQSGHGDLEEAALNISLNPDFADREMYEKYGKDKVGRVGAEEGFTLLPAWATTRYPAKGLGYLDFDVKKAEEYTTKKAERIADTFLEAIQRWEMMESWKK